MVRGPSSRRERRAGAASRLAILEERSGNAGAEWIDQEVVVDGHLVSSRKPDDIPAFNREMIALFGRAHEQRRRAA